MNLVSLGESINEAGREFKIWFTEFTLVYSPILIVGGLILTGLDIFLNLGMGNSLYFKIPWSIAQLFAVDGLWFAVWNRILTDEYKLKLWPYHVLMISVGLSLAGIAIVMNLIIFTQDYLGIKDSIATMNHLGIPIGSFLLTRSILLMLTATLAIVLDKVMRSKPRYSKKSSTKPAVLDQSTKVVAEPEPTVLALPEPARPDNLRESIKGTMERFIAEGRKYTYQDIVNETGASLQTVKVYAPKIRTELETRKNGLHGSIRVEQ